MRSPFDWLLDVAERCGVDKGCLFAFWFIFSICVFASFGQIPFIKFLVNLPLILWIIPIVLVTSLLSLALAVSFCCLLSNRKKEVVKV